MTLCVCVCVCVCGSVHIWGAGGSNCVFVSLCCVSELACLCKTASRYLREFVYVSLDIVLG